MSLSFAEVAHAHQDFIHTTLQTFEQQLHPSATEDAELVTRAMFSVRNQVVKLRNYSAFHQLLVCQIQDVRIAEVTIDFPHNHISCSCPQKNICRHQLAVIFKLAQYSISLQDWVSKWRSQKNVPLKSLASERSPESWQNMVDEILNYTFSDNRPVEGFLISSLLDNARSKLRRHRPFEREWQTIFDLFIEVAILKRLWQHAIDTNMPINSNYFNYYLNNTFDRVFDSMDDIFRTPRLFAAEPFFDALQENVRAIAFMKKGASQHRLMLYLNFWGHVFDEPKRIRKELDVLENTKGLVSDIDLNVLKSAFYVLTDDTVALQAALTDMNFDSIDSFIEIASFAIEEDHFEQAELILKSALPLLPEFIHNYLSPVNRQKFTRLLNHLYAQIKLTEEDELSLYSAFGKYGIDSFSEYLLRNERYTEWVALHQLYPSSISYLDQTGLKDVVASKPEVALPLYHFYAMNEIQQKSRQNYKQAVRIWRAMKTASRKAGKLDYFESYIEAVQQQFKRLRALQEEIQKSNLIV